RALEALVDAGEPEVGHVVELAQSLEHGDADALAVDLAAVDPHQLFDLGADRLEHEVVDRAVLRSGPHAVDQLGPAERLPLPRALDDDDRHLLDPLEGGEPPAAAEALAPPPDGAAVLGQAGSDHLVPEAGADRAAHAPHATGRPRRSVVERHALADLQRGAAVARDEPVDDRPHVAVRVHALRDGPPRVALLDDVRADRPDHPAGRG